MKQTQIETELQRVLGEGVEGKLTPVQTVRAIEGALGGIVDSMHYRPLGARDVLSVSDGRDRYPLDLEGMSRREKSYVREVLVPLLGHVAKTAYLPKCMRMQRDVSYLSETA